MASKEKQVLKVEMFGKAYAIYQHPGIQYEFKVYELAAIKVWKDEFESFQEAWTFVEAKLWGGCYR